MNSTQSRAYKQGTTDQKTSSCHELTNRSRAGEVKMVSITNLVNCLLLSSLALVCGSWIDTMNADSECKIERVTTTVKFDGCEDASIIVRACNGACYSAIETVQNPPFFCPKCESCQPILHEKRFKRKRVQFMCNGTEATHRVYMPLIQDCKCVGTTTSINNSTYVDSSV